MNFSDVAFERLSRTSPEISKYIISFIDLTADLPEQQGIELGVFILGTAMGVSLYIPVISKAGNVFPIDTVYNIQDSKFFPLIETYVQQALLSNVGDTGRPVTIPSQVNQNPSVRKLIDPPRTGKHAYAGTMLDEAAYQLSPAYKQAFLTKIASDKTFGLSLQSAGINVKSLVETLQKQAETTTLTNVSKPGEGLKVVTEGTDLGDDVIQSILGKGWGYVGQHDNPRLAIEYDATNDGYTQLTGAIPGSVYTVVMKDGSLRNGFIPPRTRTPAGLVDSSANVNTASFVPKTEINDTNNLDSKIIVFEDGTYMTYSQNPVVRATTTSNMDDIIALLADRGKIHDIKEIAPGQNGAQFRGFLITDRGWLGPMAIYKKSINETGITYHVSGNEGRMTHIHVSDNLHGSLNVVGTDIFVNGKAAFIQSDPSKIEPESSVTVASVKRNLFVMKAMQPVTIKCDCLDYYINGAHVGGRLDLVRRLAEHEMLEAEIVDSLVKRASHDKLVTFWMSKQAGNNIADPSYSSQGVNVPPQEELLPNVQPDFKAIQGATMTGDKSAIEATIIAEFVNDPDMFETLGTYLPVIREAVDRMGRSIFLLRLNINNMANAVDPTYLSGIMTGLRNSYRNLGDSYLKLSQLSASSHENGVEQAPTGEVV